MPRYTKADAMDEDGDPFEGASPEDQAVAFAIAEGADNIEAYRKAYGAEGYAYDSLKVRACRKAAEPQIRRMVSAIRSTTLANLKLTRDDRVRAMLARAQVCHDKGQHGAALGYDKEVNELLGLKIERVEVVNQHDHVATLDQAAEKWGEEVAMAFAKRHNVTDWIPPSARGQEHASRH